MYEKDEHITENRENIEFNKEQINLVCEERKETKKMVLQNREDIREIEQRGTTTN